MAVLCPQCQRENREDARFCDQCRASLEPHVEEKRPATVLACDLAGSTSMTKSLELEDLAEVYNVFEELVYRVTAEHGGLVIKFAGDGAFVTFGYPVMREDAEVSAIRAGLALVAAFRTAKPAGLALNLRVGIASGTVKVGGRQEPRGIPWNVAVRLQQKAPKTGGVAIPDESRIRAGGFFTYRSLGRVRMKGLGRMEAWLVAGETTVVSRFEARRANYSPVPMLGRADLMVQLAGMWEQACAGCGQVVVLHGDAGIGKSRLARAMYDHARRDGGQRWQFDCTERAASSPLGPVGSVLRRLVAKSGRGNSTETREARLESILQELLGPEAAKSAALYVGPLVGIESAEISTDERPEHTRERLIETLVAMTKAAARRAPLLLLFEDVMWADPTTKYLLQKLSEAAGSAAVLIVATTRSTVPQDDLALRAVATLQVSALDDPSAEAIVRLRPGGESLPSDVVDAIVKRAEGNPLFLEEFTQAAIDQPGTVAAAGVPARGELQRAIAARLDRHPELKPIVQAASVLGREFPTRLLTELLPDRRDALPDALIRLTELGLLTSADQTKREHLRFKHSLIHEDVLHTIVRSELQRLHSRAADVLACHREGLPEAAPDLLAYHLERAARFEEATRALVEASDSAARRAAYAEARDHCVHGLKLVEKADDERARRALKFELLSRLGVVLSASGYTDPKVNDTYQQALALCDDGTPPTVLFPFVRGLGTFYFVRGELLNAADISLSCLALARQAERPEFLIEALSFRGYTCVYRGQLSEGRAALEQCLHLYQQNGGERLRYPSPQDAGTAAWSLLGIASWLSGDAAGAEAAVAGALSHSDRLGHKFDTAYVHVWIAMLRNMQRRFEEAEQHAQVCMELSKQHGFLTWLFAAMMHDCIAKASRAPSPHAVATLQYGLDQFIQSGAEANASFFLWGIARGLRQIGQVEEARTTAAKALRLADKGGELYFKSELLILAANLEADYNRARSLLYEALALAEQQQAVTLALRAALEILHREGRTSADPDLDRRVRSALEGTTPYPELRDWPLAALGVARMAVKTAGAADAAR
jgi:class 3 adenylate cyclase/tetratricopeptide (TPR) repeat protein